MTTTSTTVLSTAASQAAVSQAAVSSSPPPLLMHHPLMAYTFVGCDSHKHTHTLAFVDCFSREIATMTISNIPGDFQPFLEEAARKYLIEGTKFCFGLEDVSQYGRTLTRFLLDQGQLVKHVNSNLVASERNSQNSLNKSDYIDALACARVLVSRFDKLPLARVSDELFIFKSHVARRKALRKTVTTLKYQLNGFVTENYPTYQTFFHDVTCQTALAFFATYPSPGLLKESNKEALADLLNDTTGGIMGKKRASAKATHIYDSVVKEGVSTLLHGEHHDFIIRSIIRQLETTLAEIDSIEGRLLEYLEQLDIPLMSMNGIDLHLACSLISCIGDINRFKNAAALARYAGVAPATFASGKSHTEYANRRGNRELAALFYQLSVSLTMPRGKEKHVMNPFFREFYERKIQEGKTHKQALKAVQRRLVNIVYGIMKYKHDYINPPTSYLLDEETGEITERRGSPHLQTNKAKMLSTFVQTDIDSEDS